MGLGKGRIQKLTVLAPAHLSDKKGLEEETPQNTVPLGMCV